jgi:hypothetical protein
MSYTGYNVEDAILINAGAVARGIFRTTYYSMYEAHEETSKNSGSGGTTSNSYFADVQTKNVTGIKPGFDYSKLDKWGLIKENTELDDKTVVIGKVTSTSIDSDTVIDSSVFPKKGQLGYVDKSFITEGEEGTRIAKVRIREERIPAIGDKMASRAGQKGTLGLIIPEEDMPFTKDGIRPDLIINPHALPSRMTIGQLVEALFGKACVMYGGFGDCTAFENKGSHVEVYGSMLVNVGFHSSGNQILYNGMTGEQLYSDIYIGPTYYMRLKHMVKDKINYRARGPNTALTKQPVSGRANDGGLRIGEMERDSVISHGTVNFLTESMMERGDKYFMAVCNTTGLLAIYNPSKNIFISPMADGPVRFIGSLDGKDMNIENITRFGRDFSVVSIPYSLKLLIQELQTINVQMRIITEDNIQQLENMSFSKNIEKLTGLESITEVARKIQRKLNNVRQVPETPESIVAKPESEDYIDDNLVVQSPQYPDVSPAYESEGEYVRKSDDSSPYRPDFLNDTSNSSEKSPESIDYDEGEIVYYRNDREPQEWFVSKIGNNTITIQKNIKGELNPETDIKVVEKKDIYRPSEIVYAKTPSVSPEPLVKGGNHETAYPYPLHELPTSINFAPVITVVGSDNKGDILPPLNNNDNMPDFNNMLIKKDLTNSTQENNAENEKIIDLKEDKPSNDNIQNKSATATQEINFKDLIIKKL